MREQHAESLIFKLILHYALGLHFGKVCLQNVRKTREKTREKWARAFDFSRFFLTYFSRFCSRFAYQHVDILNTRKNATNMQEKSRTRVKQSIVL